MSAHTTRPRAYCYLLLAVILRSCVLRCSISKYIPRPMKNTIHVHTSKYLHEKTWRSCGAVGRWNILTFWHFDRETHTNTRIPVHGLVLCCLFFFFCRPLSLGIIMECVFYESLVYCGIFGNQKITQVLRYIRYIRCTSWEHLQYINISWMWYVIPSGQQV